MCLCMCVFMHKHTTFVYSSDAKLATWGLKEKQKKKNGLRWAVVMSYCDNWLSFLSFKCACVCLLHACTLCKAQRCCTVMWLMLAGWWPSALALQMQTVKVLSLGEPMAGCLSSASAPWPLLHGDYSKRGFDCLDPYWNIESSAQANSFLLEAKT